MSTHPDHSTPASPPAALHLIAIDARANNRTPSPTSSEIDALSRKSLVNYRTVLQHKSKLFARKYLIYYAIALILVVLNALLFIYDKQVVHVIQPTADWIRNLPGGWLVPIAIFFIISFPPLFGHELLAAICGLVWGVWIGFGITAAGTVLGEIGNFYVFRYILRSRAEKFEMKHIQYTCLAKLVREGGFRIVLIVRYSAVPAHFSTAIFSVCGLNIVVFVIAVVLSIPKQFILVYLGTLLKSGGNGTISTRSMVVTVVVGLITCLVTVAAMWYIRKEVNRVKPDVVYARRRARKAKLLEDDVTKTAEPPV